MLSELFELAVFEHCCPAYFYLVERRGLASLNILWEKWLSFDGARSEDIFQYNTERALLEISGLRVPPLDVLFSVQIHTMMATLLTDREHSVVCVRYRSLHSRYRDVFSGELVVSTGR